MKRKQKFELSRKLINIQLFFVKFFLLRHEPIEQKHTLIIYVKLNFKFSGLNFKRQIKFFKKEIWLDSNYKK